MAEDDLHHGFNKAIFCCHGPLTWPGCAGGNLCSGHKDIGSGRRRREGRAGLCPQQQRADRLAQAFCEAVVDSWELIHCDWVSWDVKGCCTLSYTFKSWMPWKALRFLLLCTPWPVSTKGFTLPETDFGLPDRHSAKPSAQQGTRQMWSPLPCLKTEAKHSRLFSHCATEPSFSNALVADFSESSAKGTYLVMGFSFLF